MYKSKRTATLLAMMIGIVLVLLILPRACHSTDSAVFATSMQPLENAQQDVALLSFMRTKIAAGKPLEKGDEELSDIFYQSSFPKSFHGFSVAFYSQKNNRFIVVRRENDEIENLRKVMNRAMVHPRIKDMRIQDSAVSNLQIDFIIAPPEEIGVEELLNSDRLYERFEFGIHGLRMSHGKKTKYFLPGDSFVRSILGRRQLARYLTRQFPGVPLTDVRFERFRSESFVSQGDEWRRLYRGIPVLGEVGREDVARVAHQSTDYVLRTQRDDGRFMYYYDASKDSFVNHEHPKRDPAKDPYYNILRHGGGILVYLYHYELYKDDRVLGPTQRAIDYLVDQIKIYQTSGGQKAGYVFYNRKSKLGGSGVALYALAEYQRLTSDARYERWARLLKEHLLSEISDNGEFYYYHIYPGREKGDPRSFSFYYPGEALIGLATYTKYIETNEAERDRLIAKMKQAMHFLLVERREKYASHYKSLPSDSWLMMAVFEAWDLPEMREDLYRDFVFNDADQMVRLMYRADDAPYPDYVGSFYYEFGDHPYPDGARAEGLTGAYELAVKVGDKERIDTYGEALRAAAWATLRLVNTPASAYSAPNPSMTIDGIRFKLTRQWFRVDTIQHVASFYMKFLPYWQADQKFGLQAKRYTLFASGDTNLARWMHHSVYARGPRWPLAEVRHLTTRADIAMTNLECVVATVGQMNDKGERRPYLYRARPEMLDVLTQAGIDVVTVGNNHSMDYGGEALLEQLEILRATGIAPVGAGASAETAARPLYVKVDDLIVAFLGLEPHFPDFAATTSSPGNFHAEGARAIQEAIAPLIEEARSHAHLVVFSPHWGANWTQNAAPEHRRLARWLIDQGVDAVLGHSSHLIHGIEVYRGRPIVYDMGNFLFDRVDSSRVRYSSAFLLEFDERGFRRMEVHPLRLRTNRTSMAKGDDARKVRGLIRKLSRELGDSTTFEERGDALSVDLDPKPVRGIPQIEPELIHRSGTTGPVPEKFKRRNTNVVVDQLPDWAWGFSQVTFERNIKVLGATAAEAVRPGYGFLAEILLEPPGKLEGSWVGIIKGVARSGGRKFMWVHPFADGSWDTALWQPGQKFLNRTLVRPPKLEPGKYELSFGIARFDPLRRRIVDQLRIVSESDQDSEFVRFAEINVSTKGIPEGPAGIN